MCLCISTTFRLRSAKRLGQGGHFQSAENIAQGAIGGEPQRQTQLTTSIHILDDDSLLHVFYLYRPFLLGEDDDDGERLIGGKERWDRGRWWYNLAHVCQRWRNIVLGSASYLGVSLVCTNGTPVADMLAHSLHLPLDIDYTDENNDITVEDVEGAILSLKQYDRLRRVRLQMPVTNLQNLVLAMDDEYPILEYLIIGHLDEDKSSILIFPETFHAPHLRHLVLGGFSVPVGSRLLTSTVGLVALCLYMVHPSTYFHLNTLLQWLSFMPQLETLNIFFSFPVLDHDIERQLTHSSITTPDTLPNLHVLRFEGVEIYLEGLLNRITTPRLEALQIMYFNQPIFSVPRLLQFVNATESLRFKSAKFEFSDEGVDVELYPHAEAEIYALSITVNCRHFDGQLSSAAQISSSLSPAFSAVEHLTFEHEVYSRSSEEHNGANRTEWRKLLGSFKNMKTLRIDYGLVEGFSRCLQLDDGEPPLEMLPELQELTYSGTGNTRDAFTSFIDARQIAGRPITLVRL